MAKMNNLDNINEAMAAAAMTEAKTTKKKEKNFLREITQETGKTILLKKVPEEWHDLIKENHIGAVNHFILFAIKEKLEREGLLD
ncbi:hypothetical protein AB0W38_00430 [Aliarcobacter butzleri]|uniref:hypothetical protein n=1 Tax=Aliarcobacter butzleri TaxID=28197 RepID=UPI00344B6881